MMFLTPTAFPDRENDLSELFYPVMGQLHSEQLLQMLYHQLNSLQTRILWSLVLQSPVDLTMENNNLQLIAINPPGVCHNQLCFQTYEY